MLHALTPALLAIVETELWPNLLDEAYRGGTAVALVNARLAPERMVRYRRLAGLYVARATRASAAANCVRAKH